MKKTVRILVLVMCAGLLLPLSNERAVYAQADDVIVIVNKGKGQMISKEWLRRVFTGAVNRWPDGSRIKVLINRDEKVYARFCEKYLMTSPAYVDGMWMREKIKNATPLPRRVPSAVIKMMVANSTVFIGFVQRSEADANVKIFE